MSNELKEALKNLWVQFYDACEEFKSIPAELRVETVKQLTAVSSNELEEMLIETVARTVYGDDFWELVAPQLKGGDTLTNQKTHDRQAEGVIQ